MDTKVILDYLTALEANNDRDWYHAHKEERQAANACFEELLQALILRIGEFDPGVLPWPPKELTFKLVRDTRFSHDKSPRLPAFRVHTISGSSAPAMGLPLHGVLHKFPPQLCSRHIVFKKGFQYNQKGHIFSSPCGEQL